MQGKSTVAGRPIHPLTVTVPIGCFVAAVACDVISIWRGTPFWAPMATALIGFGLVGALIAAAFGIMDYLTAPMTERAKEIASWHMTLNVAAIVIFGTAFALRYFAHASVPGYIATVLGILVIAVSGWLGGEIAHGHLVGSSEQDRGAPRRAAEDTSPLRSERGSIDNTQNRGMRS